MKKTLFILIAFILCAPNISFAHRSGCHRWHSCPSDTGSYVCGDLGYTSGCPAVQPKKVITPAVKKTTAPVVKNTPTTTQQKIYVKGYYKKNGTYVSGYWRNN